MKVIEGNLTDTFPFFIAVSGKDEYYFSLYTKLLAEHGIIEDLN